MNDRRALFEARREMKVGAEPGRAFKSDFAAHLFGQPGGDHKAEPGAAEAPAARSMRLDKRLKQAAPRFVRNSNPGVCDLEAHQRIASYALHDAGADVHLAF